MVSGVSSLRDYKISSGTFFKISQRPAANTRADFDATTAALTKAEPNSGIEQNSDPLDLFGSFGQSVKAVSRLSDEIAQLTSTSQGLINSTQRAAIDKELEAKKAEVARIAKSDQFQNAASVFQDVSERLRRGESRESIAANLSGQVDLLGSGFFKLLQNASADVFSAIGNGAIALSELSKTKTLLPADYSKKLNSLIKEISGSLRGETPASIEPDNKNKENDPQANSSSSTLQKPNFQRLNVVA